MELKTWGITSLFVFLLLGACDSGLIEAPSNITGNKTSIGIYDIPDVNTGLTDEDSSALEQNVDPGNDADEAVVQSPITGDSQASSSEDSSALEQNADPGNSPSSPSQGDEADDADEGEDIEIPTGGSQASSSEDSSALEENADPGNNPSSPSQGDESGNDADNSKYIEFKITL